VVVAVVDSGVHPDHPHVGGVSGGVALGLEGEGAEDYLDRLGHGTAVAAVIREKAPSADILAVKVFGTTLETSRSVLMQAIDWASERDARLINLSLGTSRLGPELPLWASVQRALERGSFVVSPREHDGTLWFPGCLDGAIGVELDWSCPRSELRVVTRDETPTVLVASGFPRPIPGVPPERNLRGVSFSVANVTGLLALALEGRPEVKSPEELVELLVDTGQSA
jgi:hypothetical protein